MSQNTPPSGGGDILKAPIAKINVPVLLFAIAVIVALGMFGSGIPRASLIPENESKSARSGSG